MDETVQVKKMEIINWLIDLDKKYAYYCTLKPGIFNSKINDYCHSYHSYRKNVVYGMIHNLKFPFENVWL